MTKEEYKKITKFLSIEQTRLCEMETNIRLKYQQQIEDYVENEIGLKVGEQYEMRNEDGSNRRTCTFNGVQYCQHQHYFYLEFTYPMLMDNVRAGMSLDYIMKHPEIFDINSNPSFKVGDKFYNYYEVMNKYQ